MALQRHPVSGRLLIRNGKLLIGSGCSCNCETPASNCTAYLTEWIAGNCRGDYTVTMSDFHVRSPNLIGGFDDFEANDLGIHMANSSSPQFSKDSSAGYLGWSDLDIITPSVCDGNTFADTQDPAPNGTMSISCLDNFSGDNSPCDAFTTPHWRVVIEMSFPRVVASNCVASSTALAICAHIPKTTTCLHNTSITPTWFQPNGFGGTDSGLLDVVDAGTLTVLQL